MRRSEEVTTPEKRCRGCRQEWIWGDEFSPSPAYLLLDAIRNGDEELRRMFRQLVEQSSNRQESVE